MTKESSDMAALLLLLCIVPAAASAVITKPHFKTEKVYLYHNTVCPENTFAESHWPDGRVTCLIEKKPYSSAVSRFPRNGEYLKSGREQ
jgi:hypothetical protein